MNAMSRHQRGAMPHVADRVGRATVAEWLMLVVALAGLMAMHGFSDHGVGGLGELPAGSAGTPLTAPAGGPIHSNMDHVAASAVPSVSEGPGHGEASGPGHGGDPGDGHGGGHDGMLAGACLAILAAALLLGAARWRAHLLGYTRASALMRSLADAAHALRAWTWGPAPPDLTRLSILRC